MTYKIIDSNGNVVAGGFRNWQAAKNMEFQLKIHKSENLEIVEE